MGAIKGTQIDFRLTANEAQHLRQILLGCDRGLLFTALQVRLSKISRPIQQNIADLARVRVVTYRRF